MRPSTPSILLASVALGLSACGRLGFPGGSGGPAISIDSPQDGQSVNSSSAWLALDVQGVSGAPSGGSNRPGQAHYHIYLDGEAVGEDYLPAFLLTRLSPGRHLISARLFQNDEEPLPGAGDSAVTITVPATAPQLVISAPPEGSVIAATSVEVSLTTVNDDASLWDYFVDGYDPGKPVGSSPDPTSIVPELSPGDHRIYARLLHSDGTPFDPPVLDRLDVTVPASALGITITDPPSGASVPRSPTITVRTLNFTIDSNTVGGPPVPGQGHYHIYVDGYEAGQIWQQGYYTQVTLDNLPTGEHDLWVRLMNNDHTSIEPKPADKIHLTVGP